MTSQAELLLAVQLEQAGIPFEREFAFAKSMGRRWRADFIVPFPSMPHGTMTLLPSIFVEIDGGGYVGGRHSTGKGIEADAEKASAAAILGYRVIRVTPRQVEDGRALDWIRQALGVAA